MEHGEGTMASNIGYARARTKFEAEMFQVGIYLDAQLMRAKEFLACVPVFIHVYSSCNVKHGKHQSKTII